MLMRKLRDSLIVLSMLALTVPAWAQESSLDADKLPVNIQHIKRQLTASADREEREGLNLRYFVSIYGEAPAIRLFLKDDNLKTGPVPYGAPTHQEFIDFWTPQEFRAPVMDFGSALRWLTDRLNGKTSTPAR